MKLPCLFPFLLTSLCVSAADRDTVVLKSYDKTWKGLGIYISPDKSGRQHRSLVSFHFSGTGDPVPKPSFPYGRWISLYRYKGAYYVYDPCDKGSTARYEITGDKFFEGLMELSEYRILSLTRISPNAYRVKLQLPANKAVSEYIIQQIDKKRGISVLYNPYSKLNDYRLLVSADKVHDFPLIVNACDAKAPELNLIALILCHYCAQLLESLKLSKSD